MNLRPEFIRLPTGIKKSGGRQVKSATLQFIGLGLLWVGLSVVIAYTLFGFFFLL